MLKINNFYRGINAKKNPSVLCLGYFDSVHIGHRNLIYRAVEIANKTNAITGIFTFSNSKENGTQVYTFEERVSIFKTMGIDYCLYAEFDEKLKSLNWSEFLDLLLSTVNVNCFVCGADYTFGKEAVGNLKLLKEYCKKRNIRVEVCPTVDYRGKKAATTLAKNYMSWGDLNNLNTLLGTSYFVSGKVEKDRKVGSKIGFPTANIVYPDCKIKIKEGVYQVEVIINGQIYNGVANYGSRPTFDNDEKKIEVHILDYNEKIYGKNIDVHFKKYIREIIKFDNVENLIEQIQKDIDSIK